MCLWMWWKHKKKTSYSWYFDMHIKREIYAYWYAYIERKNTDMQYVAIPCISWIEKKNKIKDYLGIKYCFLTMIPSAFSFCLFLMQICCFYTHPFLLFQNYRSNKNHGQNSSAECGWNYSNSCNGMRSGSVSGWYLHC